VAAARKWATEALKLQVPDAAAPGHSNGTSGPSSAPTAAQLFSLSRETAAASPAPTPQHINNRLKQHTEHCIICQKALKQLQFKLKVAQAAAAALAAGLIGLLSAVVLPVIVSKLAAIAAKPTAAAAAGTAVAWGPLGVAAAVLAVGAAAALSVAASTAQLVQQFVYVEFSHAHND
jgi:uncharacterized paraquat-inducible protein A